jgi:hypothetical protein
MKNDADHIVPLSHQAAALFRELKPLACGSEFVFPSLGRLDEHMSKTTLNRMFERLGTDVMCRGTLFDEGVSTVFDVVPEAGSGVSLECRGTGNRNRAS